MSEDFDYYRDDMYSPGFQPYVMKVAPCANGTFNVWIAGAIGHVNVSRSKLEEIRDNPVLSRKCHDEIVAVLSA